jgi:hypothetical protein
MEDETATSLLAAQDTAGQVMVDDATSTVATTEYSASSGGYSTGAQFPAVVDAGDSICISASVCNPNHDWTVTLSGASIDAAYPSIGTFTSLDVTSRNGDGDEGGRVNELTVTGTGGSVPVTGSQFAAAMNLPSNWFAQADAPPGGYWLAASNGGVFTFGGAQFYGSAGNLVLNKPIVGMAATPGGGGYWLVASDGGVFSFGDAQFYGSTGNLVLNKPIVGMAATPNGGGYWLVASDGGVFTFGDARFYGSLGASPPPSPVVAIAPAPGGDGYWMLDANGTVQAFGDAPPLSAGTGSPGISSATSTMTSLALSADDEGYTLVGASGQAFTFGDAVYDGGMASAVPGYSGRIVGSAANPG